MVLNKQQKKTLIIIGLGVRGGPDGFYSEDNPTERVDLRTAEALKRRGLIGWGTTGGAPMFTQLGLTDEGEKVFNELEDNEWDLFNF